MRKNLWTVVMGVGLAGAALGLGACAQTHGVEVYNETDQVVRAEMLTVSPLGESTVYSTAIVNRGALFDNGMAKPPRGQSMRVRFTLAEKAPDDENWVMLNLPNDRARTYTLILENGHLRATEFKRRLPHE